MDIAPEHWILLTLALLFFKHWYIDFVDQSMEEVQGKAIYGNWHGIMHSFKHGIGTLVVFGLMGESVIGAIILAVLDGIFHYHIDWAKMNWGNRDIQTPAFWAHLGLDQYAHQLVYLAMILLVVGI